MQIGKDRGSISKDRVELAKKCLRLIRDIAERGAQSQDPEHVGYALEELTQVLLERTGFDKRVFEPVAADQIDDLGRLYTELDCVDGFSMDMMPLNLPARFGILPYGKEQMS